MPAPPSAAGLLGVPALAADEAARAIGSALVGCSQVRGLQDAQEGLTNDDRAALTTARDRARTALDPTELDARAGELLLNRLAYREAIAVDAVESLDGNARGYSEAFAAVDRLLEQAAALLSQAVVCGPVRRLGPGLRTERLRGGDGWTEVIVPEPWPPVRLAEIALFNSSALANAMLVEGMTIQLGRTSGVATVRVRLLPDRPAFASSENGAQYPLSPPAVSGCGLAPYPRPHRRCCCRGGAPSLWPAC